MYVWVFSLSKIRFYKTRLTYNCAHLRLNKTTRKTRKNCPRMVATLNLDPRQKVRQPLFQTISGRKYFLAKNFVAPPPSPHSTYQRRGSWCQKTNHGANMVPTMVPTMVPWCQPIFSPYQIISGRKYFLVKKFPPSPPPFPLDIKTGVTGVMGVRGGGWS